MIYEYLRFIRVFKLKSKLGSQLVFYVDIRRGSIFYLYVLIAFISQCRVEFIYRIFFFTLVSFSGMTDGSVFAVTVSDISGGSEYCAVPVGIAV